MKYKLTEAQNELVAQLNKRKGVKELEFINQAMGSNPLTEANDSGDHFTATVTILSKLDNNVSATNLSDNEYFKTVETEIKDKLSQLFGESKIIVDKISSQTRGENTPL